MEHNNIMVITNGKRDGMGWDGLGIGTHGYNLQEMDRDVTGDMFEADEYGYGYYSDCSICI